MLARSLARALPLPATMSSGSLWKRAHALMSIVLGCTGEVTEPRTLESPGAQVPPTCDGLVPGPLALRRLSAREYAATLDDLFGVPLPSGILPAESSALGFDNAIDGRTVNVPTAEALREVAETTASAVDARSLVPCAGASAPGRTCAATWIDEVGRRAFRRPLSPEQRTRYLAVYDAGASAGGFDRGLEWVLTAMMQSPYFLYQSILPQDLDPVVGDVARVGGYGLASRLSYLLWGGPPDVALLDAAEGGELESDADVEAQLERLLSDPRSRRSTGGFFFHWLGVGALDYLDKDLDAYPTYTPELAQSWKEEALRFADDVTWERGGGLGELLGSSSTFVDERLASFYGVASPGPGRWAAVELPPGERFGILTMPGVLAMRAKADQSSPLARASFVLDSIVCFANPPPPADVDNSLPVPDPSATVREQLDALTSPPRCRACHSYLNPIGFAFEAYDGLGRFRTEDESGLPIDTTGSVAVGDLEGSFAGTADFVELLDASAQPELCMSAQWFRYAFGRAETDPDGCVVRDWADDLERGGSLVDVLRHIAMSDPFLFVTVPPEIAGAVEGARP